MKPTIAILLLASATALVSTQATFNPNNGGFTCPHGKSAFCASDSLVSNIIIRCTGTVGQAGNCNDNLAGVPPPGVKIFAPCWQCTPTSGNAACSYAGTVYPDTGTPFTIAQGNASCASNSTFSGNTTYTNSTFTNSSLPFSPSSIEPHNAALPSTSVSDAYATASFNNQAGALTTMMIMQSTETAVAMLTMPSDVPVAPGSGGYSYGSGNSSGSAGTGGTVASITAVGTGSPIQTNASGGNRGSASSESSSPTPTFSGTAGGLSRERQRGYAIAVAGILVIGWAF